MGKDDSQGQIRAMRQDEWPRGSSRVRQILQQSTHPSREFVWIARKRERKRITGGKKGRRVLLLTFLLQHYSPSNLLVCNWQKEFRYDPIQA